MKVLILCGSPRRGGNSDLLAGAFAKGASEHNEVEIVYVSRCNIKPCLGCNACFEAEGNDCVQHDGMVELYAKLQAADVLVIASPVYFYGISSQLKAAIDRCHNPLRNSFNIRKMALLLVGAANLPGLFDSVVKQYEMCLDFFNIEDLGQILVREVKDKGDILHTSALDEAFSFGKRIE